MKAKEEVAEDVLEGAGWAGGKPHTLMDVVPDTTQHRHNIFKWMKGNNFFFREKKNKNEKAKIFLNFF